MVVVDGLMVDTCVDTGRIGLSWCHTCEHNGRLGCAVAFAGALEPRSPAIACPNPFSCSWTVDWGASVTVQLSFLSDELQGRGNKQDVPWIGAFKFEQRGVPDSAIVCQQLCDHNVQHASMQDTNSDL